MAFYCHCCQSEVSAAINEINYELDCLSCGGQVVEVLGQGLDTFLSINPTESLSTSPIENLSTSHDPSLTTHTITSNTNESTHLSLNTLEDITQQASTRSELIHEIVGRVLGMDVQVGPQTRSSLLDVLQTAVQERQGAPVGIIIRQPASSRQLDSLSSLLGRRPLQSFDEAGLSAESFEDILHRILTTESSIAGAPPASEETINRLNRVVVSNDRDVEALGTTCGISHDPYENGDVVIALSCGHSYREEAITSWLRMHNTCPICRQQLIDPSKAS